MPAVRLAAVDPAIADDAAEPARRAASHDLARLRELGVSHVVLVSSEDLAACGACRVVVGPVYTTARPPAADRRLPVRLPVPDRPAVPGVSRPQR